MKLIIPMAGWGKRLRPQSSVTPKPLIAVAGTCMVERIVEGFQDVLPRPITDGVFVLAPGFRARVHCQLQDICERQGIRCHFVVQEEALGTAHAVKVTDDHLQGEGLVVYADTVFRMDSQLNPGDADVVAWVKEVDDPSRFGVAVRHGERIVAFVEKPQELISKEALIGIYWVRDLTILREAIDHLFTQGIRGASGEYYLTDAFDRMLKDGRLFKTASVTEWLDCGTLDALMETTRRLLMTERRSPAAGAVDNAVVIEPVFIAPGAKIRNSVVGPFVSVEKDARIISSVVRDSIVFEGALVEGAVLANSIVGAHSTVKPSVSALNVGDHTSVR